MKEILVGLIPAAILVIVILYLDRLYDWLEERRMRK